jgi:hypothetical protein
VGKAQRAHQFHTVRWARRKRAFAHPTKTSLNKNACATLTAVIARQGEMDCFAEPVIGRLHRTTASPARTVAEMPHLQQ